MTDELKRIYTYNGGVTAVLKTPIVITDTTAYYRIGQSPRVWIGSTFKVFSDASGTTQYVLGVDYVLDQHYVDIDISKQVGEACYSYLKFIKEARTIYVDMDIVGSHVDGAIINELIENDEALSEAITDIEADITAINNKNNEQDLRLSAAETVNNAQNVTLDDHEARLDNLSNVTNDAQLKRAAGDFVTFPNKATVANIDKMLIEDSADGGNKKYVDVAAIIAAGTTGSNADMLDGYHASSFLRKDDSSQQGVSGAVVFQGGTVITGDIIEINRDGSGARTSLIDFHNANSPADYTGRIGMTGGNTRILYDNAVGGSHYFYSSNPDGVLINQGLKVDYDNALTDTSGVGFYGGNGSAARAYHYILDINGGNFRLVDAGRGAVIFQSNVVGITTFEADVVSKAYNAFRMRQPNISSFWRNDGSDTYLLLTNNGDPDGTYNSLRPFAVNNSSGNVSFGHLVGSVRGFKNTLYEVNWSFAVNALQEFNVYQPIFVYASAASNTFLNVKTNVSWATDDINNLVGGAIFALTPGRYRFSGVNLTNFQIARAPSQTASDVIEFF